MTRPLARLILALAAFAAPVAAWSQQITVGLTCPATAAIGETVEVRVEILDSAVIGMQFLIVRYNPAVVTPLSTPWVDGPLWQSSGGVANNDVNPPDSVFYYSWDDLAPGTELSRGPGVTAIARFEVIATGDAIFEFLPTTHPNENAVHCIFSGPDGDLVLAADSVLSASFVATEFPPAPTPSPSPDPAAEPGDPSPSGSSCGGSGRGGTGPALPLLAAVLAGLAVGFRCQPRG